MHLEQFQLLLVVEVQQVVLVLVLQEEELKDVHLVSMEQHLQVVVVAVVEAEQDLVNLE